MTIYYIATNGSNSANGSSASPWKTISYAMQRDLKAGDTVIVRSGTYNEAVVIDQGGSAAGDVTLKSEIPGAALIRPPSGAWNAISVAANHVTVDGFDIGGARGDGIEANNVHHITILNSTVHGSGKSGIQFNWSEFITIEGNETYENGSTGWFSGISIYQNSQHHGRYYDAGLSDHRAGTTSLTTTSPRPDSTPTATASSSTTSRARRPAATRTILIRRWWMAMSSTTMAERASKLLE